MATSTNAEDPVLPALTAQGGPFHLRTIPADNGKEFTDRFITRGKRTPTGTHAFDELCQALDTEHRLTEPRRAQTNGMLECFNGHISEMLATYRFDSRESLEVTIQRQGDAEKNERAG